MEELKNVHYDAFISYRHCELDSFVAEKIHKKLEAFRLPRSVRSKVKNGKTRIERIFRDLEELPLSDNLMDPITNALNNSDYLITICSPRYLESIWCMKEIEVFLQTHDREHILVILAEGEPSDSFPEILTYEEITSTDENGNTVITRRELEPLAADVRSSDKKGRLKAIDTAVIKLSAEIFEVNYDDLKRRHRAQKIRKMAIIFGSIVAVQLIFAIIVSIMLIKISNQNEQISNQNEMMAEQNQKITEQNVEIQNQYKELEDKYAASMATVSQTLMGEGKRKDAAAVLRAVLPDNKESGYNVEALQSLYSVMDPYDVSGKTTPNAMYTMEGEIESYSISYDEKYILINDSQNICVFDVNSGEMLKKIEMKSDSESDKDKNETYYGYTSDFKAEFCGSDGLIVINNDEVSYVSLIGNEVKSIDFIDTYSSLTHSDDGRVTLALSDCEIIGIDNNGDLLYSIDLEDLFDEYYYEFSNVSFYNDRAIMSFTGYENFYIVIFNKETGEVIHTISDSDAYRVCGLLEGDIIYYFHSGYSDNRGYNTTVVSAKNYIKDQELWTMYYINISPSNLMMTDESLFLLEQSMITVISKLSGANENYYYLESPLINSWTVGSSLYYINYDSTIHCCDRYRIYDYTDYFFVNSPTSKLLSAEYINSSLFCKFNEKNYITYYSSEANPEIIKSDYEYSELYGSESTTVETFENAPDMDYRLITEAFYSDDRKYYFAHFTDHTARIYNAETFKEIYSFDGKNGHFLNLKYSELTKGYILNGKYESFILNDNLEVVSHTDRIIDEKDGKFIMMTTKKLCYEVPYVSYEDLIKRTDSYLKGYEPSDSVKQKYKLK
ncbi:MAG: toll/interleukin-1 receptor domain-containing protein [Lachnospiraceae bacterium]|nr:toll/interleukin-1 receptor domain-containing protein [Lachnospiraceae bacterium]